MISPATIDAIRQATDVASLIEESGLTLRSASGGRKLGFCPFCAKSPTPVFNVYRDHYFCHRCRVHGSAFDWLILREKKTFSSAAQYLADRAGIQVDDRPVNRVSVAADKEDTLCARWWWQQRRAAVSAALADAMDDISWAECLGRMLRAIDGTSEQDRLQQFRCHVTSAERAEWRGSIAWDREFRKAWVSL